MIHEIVSHLGDTFATLKEDPRVPMLVNLLMNGGWMDVVGAFVDPVSRFFNALAEFRKWMDIPETGAVDEPILRVASRPRCGCRDVAHLEAEPLKNRDDLTWKLKNTVSTLPVADQHGAIQDALQAWVDALVISTVEVPTGEWVTLRYGRGAADDLDGRGGTLAWAEVAGRQLCIDADEAWSRNMLLATIVHEWGHILGLQHTNNRSDVMYPYLGAFLKPQAGDVAQAVRLGFRRRETPVPTPTPTPDPTPTPKRRIIIEVTGTYTLAQEAA